MNEEKVYKVELMAVTVVMVHAGSKAGADLAARGIVNPGDFDIVQVEVVSEGPAA